MITKLYPRAFQKLFCEPLLLHPNVREALESALLNKMGFEQAQGFPTQSVQTHDNRIDEVYSKYGDVAVIKIHGIIDKQISQLEAMCYGGVDLQVIDQALLKAEYDETVNYVVLDISSPGGTCTGLVETASRIAKLRQTKEIHSFSETQICSAAYFLASQADVITVNPSTVVGSVGVFLALTSREKQLEMEGIKVELIKAGKYKAMGSPFKTLTDEERTLLQAGVDNWYNKFTTACTELRDIPNEAMQGQTFLGDEALAVKMVDHVTIANLDEYVSGLLTA